MYLKIKMQARTMQVFSWVYILMANKTYVDVSAVNF